MHDGSDDPHDAKLSSAMGNDPELHQRVVEPSLLEFLVCPLRKTTLIYDADASELISPAADLAYPIRDGVPLLVEDCARPLTDDDRRKHRIK